MKETREPVFYADTKNKTKEAYKRIADLPYTPIALDTEFDTKDNTLVLASLSRGKGRIVVRGDHFLDDFPSLLESPDYQFVFQNYKADAKTFYAYGIKCDPSFHADTLILGWLINENDFKYDLKHQVHKYLGWYRKGYADLFSYQPFEKRKKEYKKAPKPIVLPPSDILLGNLPPEMIYDICKEEIDPTKELVEEILRLTELGKKRWFTRMIEYSGDDAQSTILLYWHHRKQLEEEGYWNTYLELDKPFTLTLMRCGERGIKLDTHKLQKYLQKVAVSEARTTHSFRALAGKPDINLRSGDQLADLFFGELNWPVRADFRTPKGKPQLSERALQWYFEEFYEPLAKLLLDFREMASLRGTFLEGLISGVDDDGRLRSDFIQNKANTGRIASRKRVEEHEVEVTKVLKTKTVTKTKIIKVKKGANLQNVPTARTDKFGIRGAFIAPEKGEKTASGRIALEKYGLSVNDMTGFELYTGIYHASKFSPHSEMKIMAQKGANIHAVTAYRMGLIPKHLQAEATALLNDEQWKKLKKLVQEIDDGITYTNAKNSNFGLFYKGGAKMFCIKLGLDHRVEKNIEFAKQMIKEWNNSWPEVAIYQKGIIAQGYKQGFIQTISGRRVHVGDGLYFEHPDEEVQMIVRAHWERKCTNVPQATAADIIKNAMNKIEADPWFQENDALLLLQVHDEILNETPMSKEEECIRRVQDYMRGSYREELGFEIPVEGKVVENWRLAK